MRSVKKEAKKEVFIAIDTTNVTSGEERLDEYPGGMMTDVIWSAIMLGEIQSLVEVLGMHRALWKSTGERFRLCSSVTVYSDRIEMSPLFPFSSLPL
jgi:hypothetical protein